MYKVRVCFEIAAGLAKDEQGNPSPVGGQVIIGESLNEIPYEKLTEGVKLEALAAALDVDPGDITIITPAEYDERYGDKE